MKNGDISNVSSPQVSVVTDVVISLIEKETKRFLVSKKEVSLGDPDLLAANHLWVLSNNYALSLELVGFEDQGWTEELLEKTFERFERRVVNPFNYWELYSNIDEYIGTLPYRPNLKAVIDIPGRVARYGSLGVELANI